MGPHDWVLILYGRGYKKTWEDFTGPSIGKRKKKLLRVPLGKAYGGGRQGKLGIHFESTKRVELII